MVGCSAGPELLAGLLYCAAIHKLLERMETGERGRHVKLAWMAGYVTVPILHCAVVGWWR